MYWEKTGEAIVFNQLELIEIAGWERAGWRCGLCMANCGEAGSATKGKTHS